MGDGVVVLNQQADEQGKKQAFNQLGIVSGRPTVKLESADQVNPNNIYFGFRGGRLDLNGHSLTFNRIKNTDEGAQIVNHNKDTAATVTLLGNARIDNESKINQSKAAAFNGWFGETNTGLHNGRLDVVYRPAHADSVFLFSGGTNLNGNITQENGTLVLSGRPTPHAYNHQNRPALIGRPQGEVVIDDDWLNRTFKAKKFIINGGSAVVSRNVSAINSDWQLSNNANAALGVTDKQANFICARSDWTGLTKCANQTLSDKVFSSIERSKINGNFNVSDKATLSVQGLADMVGNVELTANSQYSLIHGATQTGALRLSDNATARVDNATLIGDVSVANQAQYQLANNATQNGNLTLSDTAQATVVGAKLNGNTASSQHSQYRLIDGAVQTGSLMLSNEANALVNNATLSGDVSVANQAQYQLANNATQNGALRLKDHSKALVNAANLKGNVILSEQAELNLNNTTFSHNINGSANSRVMLTNQTNWVLSGSSTVGHLALDNSQVTLNSSMNFRSFNTLRVLGDLNGNGSFNYRTYLEHHLGEHVEVNGVAKGNFVLNVNNSGKEPQTLQQLSLLTLKNAAQQIESVQVSLANGTVDAGTYRYELKNFNNDYRLYNPKKEQELAEQARLAEEKRKAEEAIRLAEEKRKAEEAARLAEEKRKADEVARLVEEKRKAEEAARLAEEKRKAEEAARLAEEKRKAEEQARLDAQRKALEQESAVKKQKELISRYANSALSELSASVNSALLAQDELNKHLVSENNTNVWANTLYSSRHYDADEFRAYQQKARLTQVGVQHIDTNHRLGLLFSHSRVSNAFDDNISSKGRLNMLSAFAKYDFENGLNLSADAGYGLSAGEIRGESQNAKIKRRIATIGMGLGYQLNLDKLAIRPHVGIHRYYISADSYTYAGVNVHSPKMSFNAYHAGVTVDYAFMPWEGVTIRPALTLNYVDASDSKIAMQVNQSQLTQRFDRYWQQEIGVTTDFASWQIATYAGKSRGKQLDKQFHIGLKVGYRW